MAEQLQAEPHEATRRRISARAPTDDDADGVLERRIKPKDDCRRASELPMVPLAEELMQHSSAPHRHRTQA
jgi:hypothetical protein